MPALLKPAPHLSLPEVEKQYKEASNSVEKIRFLIIKLLLEGKRCPEIATVVGYCVGYVRRYTGGRRFLRGRRSVRQHRANVCPGRGVGRDRKERKARQSCEAS